MKLHFFDPSPDVLHAPPKRGNAVTLPTPAAKTDTVDIVVARYSENIAWLDPIRSRPGVRVIVYDKNDAGNQIDDCYERLPNIGRESHTYLHHIVSHFDSLSDVTVFIQGRIDDHIDVDPIAFIDRMISEAKSRSGVSAPRWMLRADPYFRHTTYFGKPLQHATTVPFGKWFAKYIREAFPRDTLAFYKNGLFAVSRHRVLSRSVEYYRAILDTLTTEDPEEGHFCERSWWYIFGN